MDFELTNEQKAIQKAAWDFADGEFDRDIALEFDVNHRYPHKIREKACELGFVGVRIPEEYGGQGYGLFEQILITEQFCRRDPSIGMAIGVSILGTQFIMHFGTDEQKREYLPKVTSGKVITAAAFTEPDHGSDLTQLDTTAVRDGDEYVINGSKIFITNGCMCDFAVVLCQTDSSATPAYRGMSTILVESDRKGWEATEVGHKMGTRMVSSAEIVFKNVRVPITNLIGQENRGFHQLLRFLGEGRIDIAAQALGAAQGAFDRALSYTKSRRQFGRRIADFQVTQHKFADMATKIETARLILYKSAWTWDHKGPDPKLASMAKLYCVKAALEVADEAIQLLGGYGYFSENEVERIYRDVRVLDIVEGTREIQKGTIADYVVGKSE